MQPSRRHCFYASLAAAAILCLGPRTFAETLTISSSPPGATLQINGVVVGTAPYRVEYPGGYFHKPHTVFSARLERAMMLRVSKDGYLTQEINISSGPFEWVGLTGRRHGSYFLLKSDHFEIKLEPGLTTTGDAAETISRAGPIHPRATPGADSTARQDGGSVSITSDSPGADIYVDGKFVGQTPSTIHLSTGPHRIEVKASGKQTWQRELEVLKDSQLTLRAVVE